MIRKVISRIVRTIFLRMFLVFKRLTPNEADFIKVNSQYWKLYGRPGGARVLDRYVLVRPEQYPLIAIGLTQIASFIGIENNLKLLLIVHSRFDRSMCKVLRSFPGVNLVFEDSLRFFSLKVLSLFQAFYHQKRFKGPEDILSFEIDGLIVGDLIYDSALTYNKSATIENCRNLAVLRSLQNFFYQRNVILNLMKDFKIEYGITGHVIGIGGGTFLRYLLQKNIKVVESSRTLRKYVDAGIMHEACLTPEKKFIDFLIENKGFFLPLAKGYLKQRLSNPAAVKLFLPFKSDKRVFSSKEEFSSYYKLDVSKKNAVVVLHVFNDFPHTFGRLIYRDYYQWLKAMLKAAKDNPLVNWIFKEHPYADYYQAKDVDLKKIFDELGLSNVVFLSKDSDFNTASLAFIADVIITCSGTAGLEFSAFGVPCIAAGNSCYCGFGFTYEPATHEELVGLLSRIDSMPKLSEQKQDIANLVAYFIMDVIELAKSDDPFAIVATHDFDLQRHSSSDQIFELIVNKRMSSTAQARQMYVDVLAEFLRDPDWHQFIDLNRHSYFRQVLQKPASPSLVKQ